MSIKVDYKPSPDGVLLVVDGWPQLLIPDDSIPALVSVLKARQRSLLRLRRASNVVRRCRIDFCDARLRPDGSFCALGHSQYEVSLSSPSPSPSVFTVRCRLDFCDGTVSVDGLSCEYGHSQYEEV